LKQEQIGNLQRKVDFIVCDPDNALDSAAIEEAVPHMQRLLSDSGKLTNRDFSLCSHPFHALYCSLYRRFLRSDVDTSEWGLWTRALDHTCLVQPEANHTFFCSLFHTHTQTFSNNSVLVLPTTNLAAKYPSYICVCMFVHVCALLVQEQSVYCVGM
jgi:hypothetical protein